MQYSIEYGYKGRLNKKSYMISCKIVQQKKKKHDSAVQNTESYYIDMMIALTKT